MGIVLRIIDRFNITGRGVVYTLKNYMEANLKMDDILYDLQGNQFRIKAFEMIHACFSNPDKKDIPLCVLLENLDETDVEGTILVQEQGDINFIFCNHPLYLRKVDEDYEEEYQEAGLEHPCALFSYEDLEDGKLSLYGEEISGLTVYRGWMMKPEMYRDFYLHHVSIYHYHVEDKQFSLSYADNCW